MVDNMINHLNGKINARDTKIIVQGDRIKALEVEVKQLKDDIKIHEDLERIRLAAFKKLGI